MVDDNELLFVVDEQNKPVKPLTRHIVHKKVLWHRATGIWVINKKKHFLCQKRSLKLDLEAGKWSPFFGGHLHPKDSYLKNAIEELSEELGISVEKKNLIPYKIVKKNNLSHREFQHIFIYLLDNTPEIRFEKDEVDDVKWFTIQQIKNSLLVTHDIDWVKNPWDEEVLRFIQTSF